MEMTDAMNERRLSSLERRGILAGTPRFKAGDQVQRVSDPDAVGIVAGVREDFLGSGYLCEVQFGAQRRTLPESALLLFSLDASSWQALARGKVGGHGQFVSRLTLHRLRKPPTRIAYSFATSRTEFYPHQFKPLLKFLDHPGKRLLVADDVGLGKTIEAGYILRELRARQAVQRVLVVVPARLRRKWQREMELRFEETFEVVGRRELLSLGKRLQRGVEPDPFRWITSYESARLEDVREALETTSFALDVLIADEAHRLRNPATLQHRIGRFLTGVADTALFLSATPVQTDLADLWNLLRLLSPEEFGDYTVFESQVAANAPLLRAQVALTAVPPAIAEARKAVEDFRRIYPVATSFGGLLSSVEHRLSGETLCRADALEVQADLSTLSPTGHIISRTRKVEAIAGKAVREARRYGVILSDAEREFYEGVQGLCRELWGGEGEGWGFRMALLMAYRLTASCIPAAVQYFSERLHGTTVALADLVEEEVEGDDERTGADPRSADPGNRLWQGAAGSRLKEEVARYARLQREDQKLAALRRALADVWAEDEELRRRPRKIVLFSFFRRTLEYLHRQLRGDGLCVRLIHGGMKVDDREQAIDEFLEEPDVRVLLTSEVGGEGIDLQEASVVVNYDLPWNPMVVEQRIGRVDRIGQQAERIVVLNLFVADSIEETIVERLLRRIGVFRHSIGELDAIVGDSIEEITREALSGRLSPEEVQRKVRESGDAIERTVQEARRMLSRVDGLLAADQALVDEINSVVGERQLPSPEEMLLFLNGLLAAKFPGTQLPQAAARSVVDVDLRGPLAASLEAEVAAPDASALAKRIGIGPIRLTLSREAAYRHPGAELLHLRHPIVRLAVRLGGSEVGAMAFCLKLPQSRNLAAGWHAFAIHLVEYHGGRAVTRLVGAFASLQDGLVSLGPEETSGALRELADVGASSAPPVLEEALLDRARRAVEGAIDTAVHVWTERERRLEGVRREQQSAAQLAIQELKVRRAMARIRTLEERGASARVLAMAKGQLAKAEQGYQAVRNGAPADAKGGFEQLEVAVGMVFVDGRVDGGS